MKKNTNENYYLADWLEGKISDNDLKNKISDEDFLEYQKMKQSFDILSELNAPMDKILGKIHSKIKSKSEKESKIIPLFAKLTIGIAVALILFLGFYSKFTNTEVQFKTTLGKQRTITLLDGSEVILNAKSSLKYNKKSWKKSRELTLDGEAYFKVTKGSDFKVNTKNGSVTVLGTQFNVKSRDDFYQVVCYEGKVRVISRNNTEFVLTPKKKVTIINNKKSENTFTNITYPEWLNGESVFENTPLKYVLNELENQFEITFERNSIDENIKFTGSFDNKKMNIALATVFKPLKISYQIKDKKIQLKQLN